MHVSKIKKNYYTMHQRNKCLCLKPRNYQYSVRRIYIVGLYDEKVLLKNLHSGFCFRENKTIEAIYLIKNCMESNKYVIMMNNAACFELFAVVSYHQ